MLPQKPQKKKAVYLDHAAATPLDPRVYAAMKPWLKDKFANPSALYEAGVAAREAIDKARELVAGIMRATSDTVIFTGGGTESCSLAILGCVYGLQSSSIFANKKKPHIISTIIEHHAVLRPLEQLEREGCIVTYLPVDTAGRINPTELLDALRPETVLVSIMSANNEIGTILPIADIGREILQWRKVQKTSYPYFHTDACQASGYLDLNVEKLHVDLLSANGSKVYGPKGVGFLYKRRGLKLQPIMRGGRQEFGLRPGTENVAGIVGLSKAMEIVQKKGERESMRVADGRDYFWKKLRQKIPEVALNGPPTSSPYEGEREGVRRGKGRLPNNLNIMFPGIDAEALILYLDAYGIQCSSGSACTTDSEEISHVLTAIGRTPEEAKSSIRFTLGRSTTKKDIDYVMKYLPGVIETVRQFK